MIEEGKSVDKPVDTTLTEEKPKEAENASVNNVSNEVTTGLAPTESPVPLEKQGSTETTQESPSPTPEIKETEETQESPNTESTYSLGINIKSNELSLSNVGYTLFIKDTNSEYTIKQGEELFSDANGNISFSDLKPGEYKLVESTNLEGYTAFNEVTFTLDKDGKYIFSDNPTLNNDVYIINKSLLSSEEISFRNVEEAVQTISVPSSTNFIKLDDSNAVVNNPDNFPIGRIGALNFAVRFMVSPKYIPDELRNDVAIVITTPKDFEITNLPSIAGTTFSKKKNADGTYTVTGKLENGITSVMVGQLYIKQNSKDLINNLPESQGLHEFKMQLFTNYGSDNQQFVVTEKTQDKDYIEAFTLKSNNKTPEYTITSVSNDYEWMPGDISWQYIGRAYSYQAYLPGSKKVSAADDAIGVASQTAISNDTYKGFELSIKKSEGFIIDNTLIDLVMPKENEIFSTEAKGIRSVKFITDDGLVYTFASASTDRQGTQTPEQIINGATITNSYTPDYTNYREAITNSGISFADLLYKAGTFKVIYSPFTYHNRLYQGDWNNTTYTADSGPLVSYKGFDGTPISVEGDPLVFKFVQGDQEIKLLSNTSDLAKVVGGGAPITQLAQYTTATPDYNDSALIYSVNRFNDRVRNFVIQDNVLLSYDYTEELNPSYLEQIAATKEFGFTYRIFITDATTGQVSRIETIVNEEDFSNGYTAQTIDGVTEIVLDGSTTTQWTIKDEDVNNKLFVSRIEVSKRELEYNQKMNQDNHYTGYLFAYKLRAYHARLSDGTDIPNDFNAKVHKELTSDQIQAQNGGPFEMDYTVVTTHFTDDIEIFNVLPNNYSIGDMEINRHTDTGLYTQYNVRKTTKTMDYNLNLEGKTIQFGEEGYNPVITELSGDGVTIIDRVDRSTQRLLGVWFNDVYYDLKENGVNSEEFLIDGNTQISYTTEVVTKTTTHDSNSSYVGKLYNLPKIFEKLGIPYATGIVVAHDMINEWIVNDKILNTTSSLYINKVEPGYLNFDNVIGKSSDDLPKRLKIDGKLFCAYSDYINEAVNGNEPTDINGGTNHGSNKTLAINSATLINGSYPSSISILDEDYYVNPFSRYVDNRGKKITSNAGGSLLPESDRISNTIEQSGTNHEMELTRVVIPSLSSNKIQMNYQNAVLDFEGTDPKLLSLTNSISVDIKGWVHYYDVILEYTLNDGTNHVVETAFKDAWGSFTSGRIYLTIPEVDIANGKYVTALKIKFPNDNNWGNNTQKWLAGTVTNHSIPNIGLGMSLESIPSVYPGTNIKVGSVSDNESTSEYDKLTVKAKLSFEDLFGKSMTTKGSKNLLRAVVTTFTNPDDPYSVTGTSNRIKENSVEIDTLVKDVQYSATSVNQGSSLNASVKLTYVPTFATENLFKSNNVKLRPVYYLKVDKNFRVDVNSVTTLDGKPMPEGIIFNYVEPGTDENESGSDDYGYIVVSYENVDRDEYNPLVGSYIKTESGLSAWISTYRDSFKFTFTAQYNSKPINTPVITDIWMDLPSDSGRLPDNNTNTISSDTANSMNQLKDNAPLSSAVGNLEYAKNTNNDAFAEMLYVQETKMIKIQEQAIQGVLPYVVSTNPYVESTKLVESKDLYDIENIFNEKLFMTGDETTLTKNWEVYIPVTKKGDSYSYIYAGQTKTSRPNDFSMDLIGFNTEDLEKKTLDYNIYFTTDENPGKEGYTNAKEATWIDTEKWKENIPDDLSTITMVKLTVSELIAKEKVYFDVKFKLNEHKSVIGKQENQTVGYANYEKAGELVFGDNGQNFVPESYILTDMSVTGFVWEENDYNSTYDQETKVPNVEVILKDLEGNVVNQGKQIKTNTSGVYKLVMPNDGPWDIEMVVPNGKKLVNKDVNGNKLIDSSFDRTTNIASVDFTADANKKQYELKNVNGGIYVKPVITLNPLNGMVHVNEQLVATATISNQAPDGSIVEFGPYDEVTIATSVDNKDNTLTSTGISTGITKGKGKVADGYGGFEELGFTITTYSNVIYDANTGSRVIIMTTADSNDGDWISSPLL